MQVVGVHSASLALWCISPANLADIGTCAALFQAEILGPRVQRTYIQSSALALGITSPRSPAVMPLATNKVLHQPAVSLTKHPATLPVANISDDVDHLTIATEGLARLSSLKEDDLANNAIWRDQLALTGTLRTFFSPKLLAETWELLAGKHKPGHFEIHRDTSHVARFGPENSWVEARFDFRIDGPRPSRCSGAIGLVPSEDESSWKIWLLCTLLERPDGFPDVDDLRPPDSSATSNGTHDGHKNNGSMTPESVECAVIGGGVAGLTMAGRLQSLGLSYVVIEKHPRVGDTWVKDRYESVKLHTSKPYNQLPGSPPSFQKEDPYHLPGSCVAEGFRRFADTFGIKILTSTTLVSAVWDAEFDGWLLSMQKGGETFTLKARHIVLAVGNMGVTPQIPQYANRDLYKGDVLHGVQWKNAQSWAGKRGVVIGSANTAHDVIADMAKAGLHSITMIQRSKTFLLPVPTFAGLVDPVYNDDTPLDLSDRILLSYPMPIQRLVAMNGIAMLADKQKAYFDKVAATNFEIERNGDLWGECIYDREGGHFFDLGSSELIVNGTVQVRSGPKALPVSYTETGLELGDGSKIDADVIVFATGYSSNILTTAKRFFGEEIGGSLREFWQCDQEGEIRGAWRHTGHPRIWYTGHGYAHARFYARFVALHIKSEVEGRPIEMYMDAEDT